MRDLSRHCGTGIARLEWKCVKWTPLSITLQSALCTALSWLLSKLWVTLLSAGLLLFLFLSSAWSSSAFWKVGGPAEYPLPIFVLNTAAQGLRSVRLEKELNHASEGRAVPAVSCDLCWGGFPLSVGINELWGEQGKVGHHLRSSHHPTSCITSWLRPILQCYPSLKLFCRKSQHRKESLPQK